MIRCVFIVGRAYLCPVTELTGCLLRFGRRVHIQRVQYCCVIDYCCIARVCYLLFFLSLCTFNQMATAAFDALRRTGGTLYTHQRTPSSGNQTSEASRLRLESTFLRKGTGISVASIADIRVSCTSTIEY